MQRSPSERSASNVSPVCPPVRADHDQSVPPCSQLLVRGRGTPRPAAAGSCVARASRPPARSRVPAVRGLSWRPAVARASGRPPAARRPSFPGRPPESRRRELGGGLGDRQQRRRAAHSVAQRQALDDRRAPVGAHRRLEGCEIVDDRHGGDTQEPDGQIGVAGEEDVALAVGRARRQQVPPWVAGRDQAPAEPPVELHLLPCPPRVEDVVVGVLRPGREGTQQLTHHSSPAGGHLGRGAGIDADCQWSRCGHGRGG